MALEETGRAPELREIETNGGKLQALRFTESLGFALLGRHTRKPSPAMVLVRKGWRRPAELKEMMASLIFFILQYHKNQFGLTNKRAACATNRDGWVERPGRYRWCHSIALSLA